MQSKLAKYLPSLIKQNLENNFNVLKINQTDKRERNEK